MANNIRKIWDADPDAAPKERASFSDDVVGRFRSGRQVEIEGKMVPESLSEWRVTTGDPAVVEKLKELLGGESSEWETDKEDNLQVLTDSATVKVIIEADGVDASFKQFMPSIGLTHHCDGFEFLSPPEDKGLPCKCPSLVAERKLAADKGRGPKPSVDVRFRLQDDPELGIFRFNSGSWKLVEALGPLFTELDKHPGKQMCATITIENVTYTPQKGARAGQEVSYNKPVVKVLGVYEAAEPADLAKAA